MHVQIHTCTCIHVYIRLPIPLEFGPKVVSRTELNISLPSLSLKQSIKLKIGHIFPVCEIDWVET
jgi:hypothetical protein